MRLRPTILVVALLAAGCGKLAELPSDPGGGLPPPDPTATFARVQSTVFTTNCTTIGCHDRLGQQSQLVLTADRSYAAIVNVPSVETPSLSRVAPGDPSNSYLYRKIIGSGITGDRMPQGQPPLSDAQIALVRDWIRRGAPND